MNESPAALAALHELVDVADARDAVTAAVAGPTCARTLALYGADALRIGAVQLPSIPPFVADIGLGKRAAFVDLKTRTGCNTVHRLIGEARVFSHGYRSGALDRLVFRHDRCRGRQAGHRQCVHQLLRPLGAWRARPGWDQRAQTGTGMSVRSLRRADDLPQTIALADEELARLRQRIDTAWGALEHLRPPVTLSGCPSEWRTAPLSS